MKRIAIIVLALAGLQTSLPKACAEDAELPRVQLKDDRWQALPAQIEPVVGLKGRVWMMDRRRSWRPTLEEAQAHIAAEFAQDVPHIRAPIQILLFEERGRVWFYVENESLLLAYDGKEWVTKTIAVGEDRVSRRCVPVGGLYDAFAHRAAGGNVWLRGVRGVYRFHAGQWDYQSINSNGGFGSSLLLAVHPDGDLAAAHWSGSSEVWLFRNGQWNSQELFPMPEKRTMRQMAFAGDSSILYIDSEARLQKITIKPEGELESTASPKLGQWRASYVNGLFDDPDGRIYIGAAVLTDADTDQSPSANSGGLLLHDSRNGETHVLRGSSELATAWSILGMDTAPILTPDRKEVWLPNYVGRGQAIRVDLTSGEIVERLPHESMGRLLGLDAKGRLFLAHQSGYSHPGLVYAPNGREPPTLKVETHQLGGSGPVAVTGDGTIFATHVDGAIICRVEDEWQEVDRQLIGRIDAVFPGTGNSILLFALDQAALYEGTKAIAIADKYELLELEHERIVKAFGSGSPPPPLGQRIHLAVSQSNKVWFSAKNSLRLFAQGRWFDATDALRTAGSRHGNINLLASIADGERVFVSDRSLRHDGGKSFVGRLVDNRLEFSPAPHVLRSYGYPNFTLAEPGEALWIAVTEGNAGRTSDSITGQAAVRITSDGKMMAVKNGGHAALYDRAGSVWLTQIRGKAKDVVNIFRDGKLQELKIPGYDGGFLCSNRPGSVYALGATGLQHLVAEAPDFSTYRVGDHFALRDIVDSSRTQRYYNPAGAVMFVSPANEGYLLQQVQLPQ